MKAIVRGFLGLGLEIKLMDLGQAAVKFARVVAFLSNNR